MKQVLQIIFIFSLTLLLIGCSSNSERNTSGSNEKPTIATLPGNGPIETSENKSHSINLSQAPRKTTNLAAAQHLIKKNNTKQVKRNLELGLCGLDVRHLNENLARQAFLPTEDVGDCYTEATFHAVSALQKWHGLTVDGVVGPETRKQIDKNVAPQLPVDEMVKRGIYIFKDKQILAQIDNGQLKQLIAVSTGQPGYETPSGEFEIFRKEEMSWSNPYEVWLPWASYFNGGIALHEYDSVPTYPASHGCVRVPTPFAEALYQFADYGTTVIVQ